MKTRPDHSAFGLLCLVVTLLFAIMPARAELIFADSFPYPAGNLDGKGPPPGSPPGQGKWMEANGSPQITPPTLRFRGIFSHGKSAYLVSPSSDGPDGDQAIASHRLVTAADGIVWVGFLVRQAAGRQYPGGYAVVVLGNNVQDPTLSIGMLFYQNRYGLENNTSGSSSQALTDIAPSHRTLWLVTKLDFAIGEQYLWINPSPESEPDITQASAELPMTDEFADTGFADVQLKVGWSGFAFQIDELRLATTFAEIVDPLSK